MHAQQADRVPARLRLWSLSEDVLVEIPSSGDHLVVSSRWGEVRIEGVGRPVCESLRRMNLGPVSVKNLPAGGSLALPAGGRTHESGQPLDPLRQVLDRLGNCIVQSLGLDGESGPLLSVAPVSRQARFWLPPDVDRDRPIRLSRFAAMRTTGGDLVLESPLTPYRVVLHRPIAAWVVGSLSSPTTIVDLSISLKIAEPVLADIVAYLVASGAVLTAEPAELPRFAEDNDPELIPWYPHDLLFHAFSRMGGSGGPAGAVFPYADRLPPAPVTKPPPDGPRFPLYRPVLAELSAADPPLTDVVEARRSYSDYSEQPLSAEQLGELLFRVGRIRWIRAASAAVSGDGYAISDRPYPSTGGLYELELYLSLDRCTGLPRGSYHYDPREHLLTLLSDSDAELAELLDGAKVAAGSTLRPPVLITVASRISRLSWVYGGVAYATTLVHVGALEQTLQLAATAMGLASCRLATGDGAVADEVLGLAWPVEVSVGEFLVGARR